jgi:DNA-binding response OmpR family regulator
MSESVVRRVLVIDDDIDCADTVAMVLRRLGAEVRVAYSGAAGLALCQEFDPELVFLDIGMPQMDGYATVKALRELDGASRRRIVALTGWGQVEDQERTLAAGFDHHLVKPADLAELRALLHG